MNEQKTGEDTEFDCNERVKVVGGDSHTGEEGTIVNPYPWGWYAPVVMLDSGKTHCFQPEDLSRI